MIRDSVYQPCAGYEGNKGSTSQKPKLQAKNIQNGRGEKDTDLDYFAIKTALIAGGYVELNKRKHHQQASDKDSSLNKIENVFVLAFASMKALETKNSYLAKLPSELFMLTLLFKLCRDLGCPNKKINYYLKLLYKTRNLI